LMYQTPQVWISRRYSLLTFVAIQASELELLSLSNCRIEGSTAAQFVQGNIIDIISMYPSSFNFYCLFRSDYCTFSGVQSSYVWFDIGDYSSFVLSNTVFTNSSFDAIWHASSLEGTQFNINSHRLSSKSNRITECESYLQQAQCKCFHILHHTFSFLFIL
jgi:hypothetical protein